MLKKIFFNIFIISFLFGNVAKSNINLYVKYFSKKNINNNILIISGIHGNEPGGYITAFYLLKNLNIYNSNYNIYILPFANVKGIINNKRSIGHDFNNLFGRNSKNKDIRHIEILLDFLKPKYVLSLHSGYSNTFGNKIIIDEKKYKKVNLYQFILPIFKESKKNIKNLELFISRTKKNRYKYGQDNFHDLSWYCLSNFNSYFYTIESTKKTSLTKQMYFHLVLLKNFFKKLHIKSNINFLIKKENIKNFLKVRKKEKLKILLYKNFIKKNNFKVILKFNTPLFIYKNKLLYYNYKKNKIEKIK